MAGKSAVLAVKIISDATDAKKGFTDTAQASREFESSLNTASIAAGATVAGLAAISIAAVDAASDLEQSGGAVQAVFGSYADEIGRLAEGAATRVGLAQSEYQQLAATLGAQMKNLGIEEENLVGQTDDLISMGADLAAVFNTSTSDAVAALSSLMRGERDPIERYGVTIKQATVEAKLAEMGLSGLEGQAKTTAEAQATLALLSEQTGHAVGMFASEADGAAGSAAIAGAVWKDAAADLGTALLPMASQGAQMLADLARTFSENSAVLVPLTLFVMGFAGAISALVLGLKAYRTIAELAAAAQVIWNVAMNANPIGLLITVIGLLIGAIVLIASNWEEVQVIWGDAIDSMIGWIEDLINWVIDAINWVGKFFGVTDGLDKVDWGLNKNKAAAQSSEPQAFATQAFAAQASDATPGVGPAMFTAQTFSAPTAVPMLTTAAAPSVTSATQPPQQVFQITVNGALDAEAVGRQLRKIIETYGRSAGSISAGGERWTPSTRR